MSTFVPTAGQVERKWHVIDAAALPLGRVASLAAHLLQGKHKPVYTPYIDTGDHVIVINVSTAKLTGNKEEQKLYRYHSGYDGGLRTERAKDVRQRHPRRLMEEAVRGMLPKSKLGDADVSQAECVRGRRAPARGPETREDRGSLTWPQSNTTAPGGARRRRLACSSDLALAPSSSIASRSSRSFTIESLRTIIRHPFSVTETGDKFDVLATTDGGGVMGQAGALRLGIARALCEFSLDLRPRLKKAGLLTRDQRIKERKKYGMAGARKRFQFSKR